MTAIALRALDPDGDLARVHGWMQEPHVAPWWELEGPPELVRAYLEREAASEHVELWIAQDGDGSPFGYVETYRVADDPLAACYDAQPGDRGFHLLVGPPRLLGTGIGRALVGAVVARLLDEPGCTRVVCEPDARNARMLALCRALGAVELARVAPDGVDRVLLGWTQAPQTAAAA